MKHYEIMVSNGHYPLWYKCSTIAEAYGCMEELTSWVPHIGNNLDLDQLMELLVQMKNGKVLSHEAHGYRISVQEGEV